MTAIAALGTEEAGVSGEDLAAVAGRRVGDVEDGVDEWEKLEHLTVRGGEQLSVGSPRHGALRELIVQAGGLRPDVIHEIANAEFPNLEHLELWLGEPNYGGDATVEDLAPLLKGDKFPKLK